MKKYFVLLTFSFLVFFNACREEGQSNTTATQKPALSLVKDHPEDWQHDNLQLYPIVADAALLAEHAGQANIKTLTEAMSTKGFRITEVKQFGREQANWYSGLTLVNKSTDTVFVMSGDVVTGGNQDRVNEEDLMALPGTIRNIDVFCVEKGRSSYYNPDADESERKLAAFRGYYNVASPRVRKAVYGGDQHEVWGAVAQVTTANGANSNTSTYAALETENESKTRRDGYIHFFTDKFTTLENVVGVVAVCDGKVIGTEVFGHPQLFERRVKALIHSYAVEAATVETGRTSAPVPEVAEHAFNTVLKKAAPHAKGDAAIGRFDFGGQWLHLYSK